MTHSSRAKIHTHWTGRIPAGNLQLDTTDKNQQQSIKSVTAARLCCHGQLR
jgi:hypothetical protein